MSEVRALADEVASMARRRGRSPRVVNIGAPPQFDRRRLRSALRRYLTAFGWVDVIIEIDPATHLRLVLVEFDRWS